MSGILNKCVKRVDGWLADCRMGGPCDGMFSMKLMRFNFVKMLSVVDSATKQSIYDYF